MKEYVSKPKPPIFGDMAERQSAYKDLFTGSENGKKVLQDILRECSVDRPAFCKGDESQSFVNMGKQMVGYHIMKLLQLQLEEFNHDR
jgi:hypothetical protein